MAKRTPHPTLPDDLRDRVRLDSPGRAGGMTEFVHALAAILARLDAEQRGRVQSEPPQGSAEERKEQL
ncbi:hypothetical protein EKD04_021575 [Chloroflexales bacterium ZM16-3]|nr:hypothetical protein [Chloroflexales bacterium ZM16-3]